MLEEAAQPVSVAQLEGSCFLSVDELGPLLAALRADRKAVQLPAGAWVSLTVVGSSRRQDPAAA